VSRLKSSRAPALAPALKSSALGATLLLGSVLLQGSCGTQQFPTPSRSLDRPSDAALFCVDYELDADGNKCLPQGGDPAMIWHEPVEGSRGGGRRDGGAPTSPGAT
jgi:hypothetical protein